MFWYKLSGKKHRAARRMPESPKHTQGCKGNGNGAVGKGGVAGLGNAAGPAAWGAAHTDVTGEWWKSSLQRGWGVQAGTEPGPCKLEYQAQAGHQKLAWDM